MYIFKLFICLNDVALRDIRKRRIRRLLFDCFVAGVKHLRGPEQRQIQVGLRRVYSTEIQNEIFLLVLVTWVSEVILLRNKVTLQHLVPTINLKFRYVLTEIFARHTQGVNALASFGHSSIIVLLKIAISLQVKLYLLTSNKGRRVRLQLHMQR